MSDKRAPPGPADDDTRAADARCDHADAGGDAGGDAGADAGGGTGDGQGAAARAQEAARAAVVRGRDLSREGWRSFRARSVYFQLRTGVVLLWIAIAALTIALAPPTPNDFVVERRDLSFGLANRTALVIVNQNSGDRDACVLEVQGVETDFDSRRLAPGRWRTRPFALAEGEKKTLFTEELFDDRGHSPSYQLEVTAARLFEDDDVLWSGTPARAPGAR
ncbi:MAG: hypothetical protein FJ137_00115 [Deltaproteobacteria bacterium]|nr:hypothetical protein [Deltaproteobacteria bacterium]